MARVVLTLSLLLLLAAVLLANVALFSLAVVSAIASITAVRGVPRWPLIFFWMWLSLVLLYLVSEPASEGVDSRLVLGVPLPAFWMLMGIWFVPILLWPLAFLLDFRNWINR